MPHILYTLDFTPEVPKDENYSKPTGLRAWSIMIRKLYEQLSRVINGLISFGNGVTRDNIDGEWASVTTPATPDTDFTVAHNMLRIPVGFILMNQTKAGVLYQGSVAWTTTDITLKCSVASDDIVIFIV